ncbi:MAG TPA: 4Fe-4S binding protein [Dehalococcoidia bacterium]|nr:4Fe-4S binding protein [Dehalococcoidia bacterium]
MFKFEKYGGGIAKGMALTLQHLFRPPITVQYPEEKLQVSRRMRGNELVWFPLKCTGCATCAKSCPHGNIEIVTHTGEDNKYIVDKFEIDTGRCMFCGLCVESCPYYALAMGMSYERSQYRRNELVLDMEDLTLSEIRQPSGYDRPEIEKTLPRQSLLIYGDKKKEEGGQKLKLLPRSSKRSWRGI